MTASGDSHAASRTRGWKPALAQDIAAGNLAELLRETAKRHDGVEKMNAVHNWWDWYAPYLSARQQGKSREEAAAAADRYLENILQAVPV